MVREQEPLPTSCWLLWLFSKSPPGACAAWKLPMVQESSVHQETSIHGITKWNWFGSVVSAKHESKLQRGSIYLCAGCEKIQWRPWYVAGMNSEDNVLPAVLANPLIDLKYRLTGRTTWTNKRPTVRRAYLYEILVSLRELMLTKWHTPEETVS